jgi:tripartite-type tricarboxylate transporter receptor subunit TctC
MGGRRSFVAAFAAMTLLVAAPAIAQSGWPNKPVHIIVGFPAGAGNDILARLVGQKMAEALGQPVVVENKPGAGAIISVEFVQRAAPDGTTLLMGASGAMSINPAVYAKLNYDTKRDFVPIAQIAAFPLIVTVSPAAPVRSVQELIAYAKANPTKANYASSSTAFQLATELFKQRTGAPLVHISYKSSNESVMAVMSQEVLLTIADAAPVATQIPGGTVRALAVTDGKRMAQFPDVPTMAEAGVPDMDVRLWSGLFAPAGTPAPIVQRLEAEVLRAVASPDVRERMKALAVDPTGIGSAAFAKVIDDDIARWTGVAKASGIQLQQ